MPLRENDNTHQLLLSDKGTLLRGVSLSFDGGDPFNPDQDTAVPSADSFMALRTQYGLNSVHVYLQGNGPDNIWPIGYNEAKADDLVQKTRDAGLYLIITIGCNG